MTNDTNVFTGLSREQAEQFLRDRTAGYVEDGDEYRCPTCGTRIMKTILHVSKHDKRFEGICAGGGEVIEFGYPHCPQCEPNVPDQPLRACIHV